MKKRFDILDRYINKYRIGRVYEDKMIAIKKLKEKEKGKS